MRFLFKVWSQRHFLYHDGCQYRKLPSALQGGLRHLTKSAMKRLEPEICKLIGKCIDTKASTKDCEGMPIWISMMQMILMYRELHRLTMSAPTFRPGKQEPLPFATCRLISPGIRLPSAYGPVLRITKNLFNTLVNMCEVCFGKKRNEVRALKDANTPWKQTINELFVRVESCRDTFCKLSTRPRLKTPVFLIGTR